MRKNISTLVLVSILSLGQLVTAHPGTADLPPRRRTLQERRTKSLLISPAALPDLPTAQAVAEAEDSVRETGIAAYAIILSGFVLLNVIPLRGNMTYIRVQILEPLYNQSNRAFTNEVLDWN
ncbi:hypothetical protein B0H13DRAFT_2364040 [Mycena leptocephala]|nr:hypothetical protein B0H13DRAFT_2364040 [Mycena leptocephala]